LDVLDLSARQLAAAIARRELRAVDAARAYLDAIAAADDEVRAYLRVTPDRALADAAAVDAHIERGDAAPPLGGVPTAIKDNMCTLGVETSCGSRVLAGFVPPYESTATSRLWQAGAALLGKTNLDEFAMGSSTENSGFFKTKNPRDRATVPGGSSGGSAAAIAAGEALLALGSDTGGSVRQPAALCGVVGMKPTYGRVSRYGLIAFASSLDVIGTLTRDVGDCALALGVIAGCDPRDATCAGSPVPDFLAALAAGDDGAAGVRIGVPREYLGAGIEPAVRDAVTRAIEVLGAAGARIDECSLPHTEHALAAYYIVAPAEASSNLARYDGVRYGHRAAGGGDLYDMYCRTRGEGFGPEVKRRIMLGTFALAAGYYDAYYRKAQQVRALVARDFAAAFARFDVLAAPTSPTVAFPLGSRAGDPLAMYMSDALTIPANLAGIPAISIPCAADGLPVGLQLIAPAFSEALLLQVAHAYERAAGATFSRARAAGREAPRGRAGTRRREAPRGREGGTGR